MQGLGTRVRTDADGGEAVPVLPLRPCRHRRGDRAARAERPASRTEIERVTSGLPRAGMMLIGAPLAKKPNPQNVVDGQFSGPFVISAALATGAMGWDSYGLLQDPTVRGLLPKVTCELDPEIQARIPGQHVRQADRPRARPDVVQKVWCRRASRATS